MKKSLILITLTMMTALSTAHAIDSTKFTYLGSFDVGTGFQDSNDSVEKNKDNGLYLGAKAVASYDLGSFYLDTGLGWFHYKVKTELTQGIYSAVHLRTQAPILQISPKYKVNDKFLLGVEASYIFDDGVMISPVAHSKVMLGLNATYRKELSDKYEMRIVGSVARTTDFTNRDLLLAGVSLQFGFNTKKQAEVVIPAYEPRKREEVKKEVKKPTRRITRVTLDETLIHFETNKYDLTMKSQALLTELAAYLASNPDMWKGLEIEGHADIRGGQDYNTILSVKRANSVYKVMNEVEMPKDRVIFLGKGTSDPVDLAMNDDSLAKNRRVELKFLDVNEADANKLMSFIDGLKKKYNMNKKS